MSSLPLQTGKKLCSFMIIGFIFSASIATINVPKQAFGQAADTIAQKLIPNVGSSVGPSLALFNGKLYAAWKGANNDQNIYYSSFNGTGWAAQKAISGEGTALMPSLAAYNGKLYAMWRGMNNDEYLYFSSFDGTSWSKGQKIPLKAGNIVIYAQGNTLSIAAFNGKLYAAWVGKFGDQNIYYSSYDGKNWGSLERIKSVASSIGPSLAAYNGKLYAAWKGKDNDQQIWFSSYDGNSWSPQSTIPNAATSKIVSLASFDNKLYAIWRGADKDQSLYYSTFDGSKWSSKQILKGIGSSHGASLYGSSDSLYAAWKGADKDQGIYFATLVSNPTISPAKFDWSMTDHFGQVDKNGIIWFNYEPYYVNPENGYEVKFDACASTNSVNSPVSYEWKLVPVKITGKGTVPSPNQLAKTCKVNLNLPEGQYDVSMTATMKDGNKKSWSEHITVKNILIVSIGDSIASGEGNPDRAQKFGKFDTVEKGPVWIDKQCHRSEFSGPAQAALQIERQDPHTSVTFLSFACSGAEIYKGLIGAYEGTENSQISPRLRNWENCEGISESVTSSGSYTRVVTATDGDMELKAFYQRQAGARPGSTPLPCVAIQPKITASGESSITVVAKLDPKYQAGGFQSKDVKLVSEGSDLKGAYIELWQGNKLVDKGFSPVTFHTQKGQQYIIKALSPNLLRPQTWQAAKILCNSKVDENNPTCLPSNGRQIDYLLISIGANDIHFSEIAKNCATYNPNHSCYIGKTADDARDRLNALPSLYKQLNEDIKKRISASHVLITEYHDPTRKDVDKYCEMLGGVSAAESRWASTEVVAKLNQAVEKAANDNGWTFVGRIAEQFIGHGYCMDDRYVRTLADSRTIQGPYTINVASDYASTVGTLHPNHEGHAIFAKRLVEEINKL